MILVQSRLAVFGLYCLIACGLTTAVGCSGRPSNVAKKVSGTVTLGGQPLPNAKIAFTPEKGNTSFGATDAEGKYNLFWSQARGRGIEGAVIGEHTVTISTFQPGNPTAKTPNEVPEKVPYKYRQDTGKLKATVKAGVNVIDFPLEAGPVEPPQPKGKGKTKGK
jgi:hypothetical protein